MTRVPAEAALAVIKGYGEPYDGVEVEIVDHLNLYFRCRLLRVVEPERVIDSDGCEYMLATAEELEPKTEHARLLIEHMPDLPQEPLPDPPALAKCYKCLSQYVAGGTHQCA